MVERSRMRALTLAKTAGAAAATAVIGGLGHRTGRSVELVPDAPQAQLSAAATSLSDRVAPALRRHRRGLGSHHRRTRRAWRPAGSPDLHGRCSRSTSFSTAAGRGSSSTAASSARRRSLAGALAVSSADLTRRAVRVNGAPARALWPYPLWCTFATALSSRIWWLNR